MRRYDGRQLTEFLEALDARLGEDADIVIIGGAALVLAYGGTHATVDIDLFESGQELLELCDQVNRETGLGVPVEVAAVADAPYEYSDRLVPLNLGLRRLHVRVPERHDWAIMKAIRANSHDLQGIEELHSKQRLRREVLVERFWATNHAIGDASRLRTGFLAMIARLFGDEAADEAEQAIAGWPERRKG